MNKILIGIQIIVSSLLVVLVLLQQRGSALGSAFGFEGSFYGKMRGLERKIFLSTVILGCLFIILSLLNLFLPYY
ncbi:MAG: preprotein translocase subunit SecG [Candidatus Pacebacteria bacterium]|nr:preprotein translocase subunit SecG [Candidatus Paceibacterota bacterium]